jgi:uncharacterized protein YndB with AHSA1/START domain
MMTVADEAISATTTIKASAEQVFAMLTDPATHASIDGTGWVCQPVDGERLTHGGQVFRMGMFHEKHWNPDGKYEMANRVRVFDPPRAISWEPGQDNPDTGKVEGGGWIWRYDLAPAGPSQTEVTLSYDWSAATSEAREVLEFPPFEFSHLENSLKHLATITLGS